MEADLGRSLVPPPLSEGYRYVAWSSSRLKEHAETKYLSFRDEVDSSVFDCLGYAAGCYGLMEAIVQKPGFLPEATWLIDYTPRPDAEAEPCGTIQGIRLSPHCGGIQNVGVTPWHRNRGLGQALVQTAMFGFQSHGQKRVQLEVTAQNVPAIRIYESLGFRRVKTVYKAVELACS